MTSRGSVVRGLGAAFVLSGAAGLIYEGLWSRYLGLFVGHGAYAQALVLAVYLGGMALGAALVADRSTRLARPILWYAAAEVALAAFGLGFHPLYTVATSLGYDSLFPAIADPRWVSAARWVLAGGLILPQSLLLGATFPLMAAALVRLDAGRPGGMVARAYLLNTFGGAAGVLIGGFWLVGRFGLPGTSVAAALLNLAAALLVLVSVRGGEAAGPSADGVAKDPEPVPAPLRLRGLPVVLLVVAAGTAFASFTYEIGWIRMLSLALGSATHSFDLMLSAFILGLGIGAWAIRRRADDAESPVRLLGWIQVVMGCAALLSIPLFYSVSFDVVAALVQTLQDRPGGYVLFNLARYAICLLVMLPASICAGMTLPLITASLLRSGAGEESIGRVYAINTIGSVAGALGASLILLPLLGLKGLVMAGAGLDALLGIGLLVFAGRGLPRASLSRTWAAAVVTAALFAVVGSSLRLDPTILSSGAYRDGRVPGPNDFLSLYYADGRTASVSAYVGRGDGVLVLATNGKPDASLGPRWLIERRDTLDPEPLPAGRDFSTQVLAPMVALAHNSTGTRVVNIGHGSGLTATALLTRPDVERVITIEIEPLMVQGSLSFLPINGPSFADPRSSFVFDDAKAFFAYRGERFDLVFAEPSNPWVSGTASLFTREFYERLKLVLDDGAVFGQWVQIYELTDTLFLSVLAALDAVFPSYRAYMVGDGDVAIVASLAPELSPADWSLLEADQFEALTAGIPPFRAGHLEALALFDQNTFRALLDGGGIEMNSDYRPVLEAGAERARFERRSATGVYSLATSRVDLARVLTGEEVPPSAYRPQPSHGLIPSIMWGRSAWLREALTRGGGEAPEEFPEWQDALLDLRDFLAETRSGRPPTSWEVWAAGFGAVEASLHWGTRGWIEPNLYGPAHDYLEAQDAPAEARAVVELLEAAALSDWPRALEASAVLVPPVSAGRAWIPADVLLDWTVLASALGDRPGVGRAAIEALQFRTGRDGDDLRSRLLRALVAQ